MEANDTKNGELTDGDAIKKNPKKSLYTRAGAYVLGASTITAIVAGLITARSAKRSSMQYLKDLGKEPEPLLESPHSLALRALAWATFYTVGVFSVTIFGLWKWYDIKDMDDLRTRIRRYARRNVKSEGRTEFESLSDFLNYLNELPSKPKPEDT